MCYFLYLGELLFGVAPLIYAVWDNSDELLNHIQQKNRILAAYISKFIFARVSNEKVNDASHKFIILQYYWISLALQVHFFHIMFIKQLKQLLREVNAKCF